MSAKRRYLLLCPVARSLDVLGDRWALLILRDLHAGPARFSELENGLGIATNLLTTRLAELAENGLVGKADRDGQTHYRLTELGRSTDRILWELAQFGALLPPEDEVREPGNLRTIVLPLRFTLHAVEHRPTLVTRFVVDGEVFTVRTDPADVVVDYGDTLGADEPDVEIHTDYEELLAFGEGRLGGARFLERHVRVVAGEERAGEFLAMFAAGAG